MLTEDNTIAITEGSSVFHYGQACFEGLKAQTSPDGRVLIFRPYENAKRMNRSAGAILMPEIPEEMFVNACIETVKANLRWVPPHGSGAALYIRPYLIGIGENLGLKPAPEYLFSVFVCPVGPYFKSGFTPVNFIVSDYDRVAPVGTGAYKVGGNYASSLKPQTLAKEAGYADCVFLDAKTRTYIEEIGSANFFGITADNTFVTPKSPSILPSITRFSLMHIAKQMFQMKVKERPVRIDSLADFVEAGACGTAAVITPIGAISYQNTLHTFYADGKEAGPVTRKLYDTLTGIQRGEQDAPEGWVVEVK
jgi:branched-chain amino acid aminotransferase